LKGNLLMVPTHRDNTHNERRARTPVSHSGVTTDRINSAPVTSHIGAQLSDVPRGNGGSTLPAETTSYLLRLQRVAGNSAVATIVQRAPPVAAPPNTPTPREDLDKAYENARTSNDWAKAAVLLNGFSDPDITTRVAALSPEDGEKLRLGTPDWAFRVRTPLLDKAYEAAKVLNAWGKAADLLNAFNDPDLNARLQRLTKEQLTVFVKNAEKTPRVALAAKLIVASDPTNTMSGTEMYQTWMKYWVGQHNKAVLDVQRIETQLRNEDAGKYAENKFLFDRGESQSYRLGPEYQEATNRLSTCKNVLQIREVHDWLETHVDSMGKHVTIQEVNTKALEIAAAKDWFRKWMEPFILLGLGVAMEASPGPRGINAESPGEGGPLGTVKGPAPLPGTRIPSAEIRFSQTTVSGTAEIEASMRAKGWEGPPIDVVRMPDSKLTALDNTRVLAASRAGIDVQANIHAYGDALPSEQVGRFTTKKGVPATWGDAVDLRIGKQSAAYRGKFAQGSQGIGSAD
jgi:hypothetical protein